MTRGGLGGAKMSPLRGDNAREPTVARSAENTRGLHRLSTARAFRRPRYLPGVFSALFAGKTLRGKTPRFVRSRCPAFFPAMPGYGRTAEQHPFASRCGDNSRHRLPALLSGPTTRTVSRILRQVAAELSPTIIVQVFRLLVDVLAVVHHPTPRQTHVNVMLGDFPKGLFRSVLPLDVVIQ